MNRSVSSRQVVVGKRRDAEILAFCLLLIAYCLLVHCSPADQKFKQYLVEGEVLYGKHCSNCHQKDGKGLGQIYPPLDQSDFMEANPNEVICLIKVGKSGEMTVNGIVYNQPMPGIPLLTELEIAEISTYIYNSWGRERGLVEVAEVQSALKGCEP